MRQGRFLRSKKLAVSNVSNALQNKILDKGASFSVLLPFLHPAKLIYDRYPNKYKRGALGGISITWREVIRFTIRDHLCIFVKHKDLVYHELHCVQRWVRFIIEVSETHVFKYIEEK